MTVSKRRRGKQWRAEHTNSALNFMAQFFQSFRLLVTWGCLLAMVLLPKTLQAQAGLNNSLMGQSVAAARDAQMQSQDYTFKYGDFRTLITPSFAAQWNDNVRLTKTDMWDDYIMDPSVRIASSYPLTQRNILSLDVSVGYRRYLNHAELSTFDLNSSTGTGLSFDIGIKDFTFNFHDWFKYTQDASQNATVANSGNYGTFQNTAGLSSTWDLNQVTLTAGYDHQNVISTSGQYNNLNHSAEMFFLRSGLQVHPQVNVGLETTASYTRYSQTGTRNAANGLNDNDAYTVGPYVTFTPGSALQITARGGYSIYQFQQSSLAMQTSDQNSWYAGLTVTHDLFDSVSYALDAGHETTLGTQTDLTEDWYFRPNITWKFIRDLTFNTGFSYQHGKQGQGGSMLAGSPLNNYLGEKYDWYGMTFQAAHPLTSRLNLALNYRLTIRSSDRQNNNYTQNMVGLELSYHH